MIERLILTTYPILDSTRTPVFNGCQDDFYARANSNLRPRTRDSTRIAVTAILVLLLVQAVTGLVLAGTDIFHPPFRAWIARWIAAPVDPATLLPYSPDM